MSKIKEDLKEKDVLNNENTLNEEANEDMLTNESETINEEIEENEITEEKGLILENSKDQKVTEETSSKTFSSNENILKEQKKYNKKLIIFLSLIAIIIILLFSTIFSIINLNNDKIIYGVSIKGIDVSNLTKEEAYNKIAGIASQKITTPFDLTYNDYKTTIIPEQLDAKFDIESSIDTAYKIGKENNIFKNNFKILFSYLFKVNISPSFSYNEEAVDALVTEIETNLPDKLVEPTYYIEGENLVITKGINGIVINNELLKLKIITNINNFYSKNEDIEIPVDNMEAKSIDIDAIYTEIYKEAKDAYYTKEPFAIYPHVDGVDFGISIDEVKQMLLEEKESYTIPLKITTPAVTTNQIGTEAFPDLLGTYSTTFSTKNVNRSINIRLAAFKINGIVLTPGQTFSYNTTVGKRTAAAGFKEAAVYAGGEVTTGIGGGICQVSSTLYNSVLLSNLEIVERYNHGFNPGYVPAGRDATVSWGGPDFKFKNNRNYPIRIEASVNGGTIITKIFGLKEENEYEVEIQSYITSYIQYKTINKNDATLNVGETKVIANGSNGCKSVCYRILKQNGEIISKTLLSNDTYNPHNKIVAIGTKQKVTTPTVTQQPTQPTQSTNPSENLDANNVNDSKPNDTSTTVNVNSTNS